MPKMTAKGGAKKLPMTVIAINVKPLKKGADMESKAHEKKEMASAKGGKKGGFVPFAKKGK